MHKQTAPRKRANWPFPAYPEPSSPKRSAAGSAQRPVGGRKKSSDLTRGGMLADICLVVVWGGSIPAVMWLGAAVGL